MRSGLLWILVMQLVGACGSSGRDDAPTSRDGLAVVYVSVSSFGEGRVAAVLVDRGGRRTGYVVDRPIWQIPGCGYWAGSEDGIPDPHAPEDSTELAPADTVPGGPQPLHLYQSFDIFQPQPFDTANLPGLFWEGGCELRIDPVSAGHVTLAIVGNGAGSLRCQDTTSINVEPGRPSRWRLRWKAQGEGCSVSMVRLRDP